VRNTFALLFLVATFGRDNILRTVKHYAYAQRIMAYARLFINTCRTNSLLVYHALFYAQHTVTLPPAAPHYLDDIPCRCWFIRYVRALTGKISPHKHLTQYRVLLVYYRCHAHATADGPHTFPAGTRFTYQNSSYLPTSHARAAPHCSL